MPTTSEFLHALDHVLDGLSSAFGQLAHYERLVAPVVEKEHRELGQAIEVLSGLDPAEVSELVGAGPEKANAFSVVFSAAREHKVKIVDFLPGLRREMALIYGTSVYDASIADALRATLLHAPFLLGSKRAMSQGDVINLFLAGRLVGNLVEREVTRFSYLSIRRQEQYLRDKIGVPLIGDSPKFELLVEVLARRNLLVHCRGIVTERYLSEVKSSNERIGDRLHVDDEYLRAANALLRESAADFVGRLRARFN